jgi:UDP-N-acetylmuramyl pentapeptide phosphotransferase/UDP-N-acetylglucosamine-1-phosphate transferase
MSGELTNLVAVAACGAVVAAAEAVTVPLLRRAAIIDVPSHRSSHTIPTPRGGGIPVAAGLLVACGLIGGADAMVFGLAVAAFGLHGLVEALHGLPPGRRPIWQAPGRAMVALRAAADLAGAAVLLVYLRSPGLLARRTLQTEEAC